jgi:hypothetical protein
MFAGMMLGGRPRYAVSITSNRNQWRKSNNATHVPSGIAVELVITINTNIEVQSANRFVGAIHLDELAAGSEVHIINNGYLLGCGGAGGAGGDYAVSNASAGDDGGPAVRAEFSGVLRLTNAAGQIWGGGGGGGGRNGNSTDGGGGGGGGAGGGAAGSGGIGDPDIGADGPDGTAGTTGRLGVKGEGASLAGDGGAYGTAGVSSSAAGGAAGKAIRHNSGTSIVWVSGSTRIAGSIGT